MSRPTWLATTAGVVVATMLTAACTRGGTHRSRRSINRDATTSTTAVVIPTRHVTIHPGGAAVDVTMRPSTAGEPRVTFTPIGTDTTPAGWQAAGRNAVVVATLLTGAPLGAREIDFALTGSTDGTGAEALMTVAVVALIRGDQIVPGVTVSGTVAPDGNIEPVGGQPPGANDANAPRDVYEAYRRLTGRLLPRLPASTNVALDAATDARFAARTEKWVATYQSSFDDFQSLAPTIRQSLDAYATAAARDEQQAQLLGDEGMQAGALAKAVDAAAFMDAAARVGRLFPILLTQGVKPFATLVEASRPVADQVSGLVAALKKLRPRTASESGASLAAYGRVIDALSLSQLGQDRLDVKESADQGVLADVAQGAVYYELAGSLASAAGDVLAASESTAGAPPVPAIDKSGMARLLRGAAEADLDAFRSGVIAPAARANKVSVSTEEQALAASDSGYALARAGDAVLRSLPDAFGRGSSNDDAELGGAINLYARTAELVAKYSGLGRVNPRTLDLSGIAEPDAFNGALQHAQAQLAANTGWLLAHRVSPISALTDDQIAGRDRIGNAIDRFDALGAYWHGYVNCRVLAYLGGLAGR